MRLGLLVALCACGGGSSVKTAKAPDVNLAVENIEPLLVGSVTNGGLWFEDAACDAEFGKPGEIGASKLGAFGKCLAGLGLQRTTRRDVHDDVSIYSYGPGFELEARVITEAGKPRLTWIGASARVDASDPPTITAEALEALRASGEADGPLDQALATKLVLDPTANSHSEYAWLKVCVDAEGKVAKVTPYASTSGYAAVAFVTAAKTWTFRPFTVGDKAVPVCAMVRPAYPAGGGPDDEVLPLPPMAAAKDGEAPLVLVAVVKALEDTRLRGTKAIVPDDDTKTTIQSAGIGRVTGTFHMCLRKDGTVESVVPRTSTGLPAYDQSILTGMQQWAYAPYLVDGKATPLCTDITFVYTQR